MKDLSDIVKKVLTEHKDARDSDFRTIGWVIKLTKPEVMNMTFSAVLWNHKELGVPSFETIRRTRQKVQHDNPDLRGEAYNKRLEKQKDYIDRFVMNKTDPDKWEI